MPTDPSPANLPPGEPAPEPPADAAERRQPATGDETIDLWSLTLIFWFGIAFTVGLLGVLCWAACAIDHAALNFVLLAAGAVAGHVVGMLITPWKGERDDFTGIRRAIWTFISGYALAKADVVISRLGLAGEPHSLLSAGVGGRLLLFFTSMGLFVILVFGARRYLPEYGRLRAGQKRGDRGRVG